MNKTIIGISEIFKNHIIGKRIIESAYALWEYERWFSQDKSDASARWYITQLANLKLTDTKLIEIPAGRGDFFGGVGIPKCWYARAGRLEQIRPKYELIADYRNCSMSLMLYSESSANGFWQGELVTDTVDNISGKAVLLSSWPNFKHLSSLVKRGAVGIISDQPFLLYQRVNRLDDAIYWHNASLHPFYSAHRPKWGFSISHSQGRNLRNRLKEDRVEIRVHIDTTWEPGIMHLLTGKIQGKTDQEVILIGHMYEPGANDNCSGLAVMLEALRAVQALIDKGELPTPLRSIRILSSMEHRGIQAYLNLHPEVCESWLAGICIDMVGSTLDDFPLIIHRQCLENPSFVDGLIGDIVRLTCKDISWEFGEPDISNDALIGEPFINTPCPVLHTPSLAYHNNFDVPDKLNAETLERIATAAAIYIWILASAPADRLSSIAQYYSSLILSSQKPKPLIEPTGNSIEQAKKIYPRKLFLGTLGIDDMTPHQLERYIELGYSPDWMGPVELDSALCFCNGSNNLYHIWEKIHQFGHQITLDKFIEHFILLKERRLVEFLRKQNNGSVS